MLAERLPEREQRVRRRREAELAVPLEALPLSEQIERERACRTALGEELVTSADGERESGHLCHVGAGEMWWALIRAGEWAKRRVVKAPCSVW